MIDFKYDINQKYEYIFYLIIYDVPHLWYLGWLVPYIRGDKLCAIKVDKYIMDVQQMEQFNKMLEIKY